METIHIVTSTNESYARYLAVMLTSLFQHKASKHAVKVYILHGGISKTAMYKLWKLVRKNKAKIRFIRVKEKLLRGIKTNKRYGKEAFYRLFIPELLSDHIEKALYLDCDLIVKKDITELWNTDLSGHYLAAVQDPSRSRWRSLRIPRGSYFNSGVLLLNLKKWRKRKITKRVIDFIRTNPDKIHYADQCGLNGVLYRKWKKLDRVWNYPSFRLYRYGRPAIIHYMSPKKPWNGKPRGRHEYKHYHKITPW